MIRAGLAAGLLAVAGAAIARDGPQSAPVTDAVVRDPEFGVTARYFGLERRVQMLQWRTSERGYSKTWAAEPVDSSDYPPAHANPEFRLRSRRWIANDITVDGKPLDPRVIAQLGQWREFRPGFSSLPGDVAATFQPEGDGLGSAENPLAPQIGDLRISWRGLTLPLLAGRIELRDGRWQLAASAPAPPGRAAPPAEPPARQYAVPLGIGALVLALVALWLHHRRHRRDRNPGSQSNPGSR